MMFATCAHIGCYRKIEYNPDSNKPRPRYCPRHMGWEDEEAEEPGEFPNMELWILPTRIRNNPPKLEPSQKLVTLICPICKTRKTSPENLHGYIEPCETEGCSGRMIYHKDVK